MATLGGTIAAQVELRDDAQRTAVEIRPVDGLAGDGLAALDDALAVAGLPARLSAHPTLAGMVLLRRTAFAPQNGFSRAHVRLEWGPAPVDEPENAAPGTWMKPRLRALSATREVTVDNAGNPMVLNYTGATGASFTLKQQLIEVEITAGGYALEVDQVLAAGSVASTFAAYRGAVNVAPWNGGAARTWLCGDDLSAEPIPGTNNYLARWSFLYSPATWDHTQRVRLAGLVPNDAVSAGGQGTWTVLPEVDFSPLTVTLP